MRAGSFPRKCYLSSVNVQGTDLCMTSESLWVTGEESETGRKCWPFSVPEQTCTYDSSPLLVFINWYILKALPPQPGHCLISPSWLPAVKRELSAMGLFYPSDDSALCNVFQITEPGSRYLHVRHYLASMLQYICECVKVNSQFSPGQRLPSLERRIFICFNLTWGDNLLMNCALLGSKFTFSC